MKDLKRIEYKRNQIICAEGENKSDLYHILKGEILIFVNSGSKVTPIATLKEGEYFGELSFFDKLPRSANAMALTNTEILEIPLSHAHGHMPSWLITVSKFLTGQIRKKDELLQKKGIKKATDHALPPLEIKEQASIYKELQSYLSKKISPL